MVAGRMHTILLLFVCVLCVWSACSVNVSKSTQVFFFFDKELRLREEAMIKYLQTKGIDVEDDDENDENDVYLYFIYFT